MTATHLDANLTLALQGDAPTHFWAIEVAFPGFTLRLLDGPGTITLNGNTFVGADPTYGTLILPDTFNDGVDAEAPNIQFGIQVPTNAAAATLCDPAAQGSLITLWYSALNKGTGVAYTPYQQWFGALDVPVLVADKNSRSVRIDGESFFGPFNDSADGWLLTNAAHQLVWPGENGLQYVVDVQFEMPWGTDGPRPTLIKDILPGNTPSLGVGAGQFSGISPGGLAGSGGGGRGLANSLFAL